MSTGRGLAVAAIVVVIAALGMGLWASGSPATQRELRLDERRVVDLQGIVAALERHHEIHRELPSSLEAVSAEPGSRLSVKDPVSGAPYDYETVDATRYRVCANFTHDTAAQGAATPRAGAPWWHGSGRHCFDRRVQEETDE